MTVLARLLAFRSIERPSVPLSSGADELYEWFGATRSLTGESIGPRRALQYGPLYRGVDLISSDVARIPVYIYRREGEGKTRAREHPAYRLVLSRPNESQTAWELWRWIIAQAILYGNGYAAIERDGSGAPVSLVPLLAERTIPVREGGARWYVYDLGGAREARIPGHDVIHLSTLSLDGLGGLSIAHQAREALGLGLTAEGYGSVFFRNAATPAVALEHPGKLTEQGVKALREAWDRMHTGLDAAHRVAILQEGMKANPLTISAKDAQLLELRQFQVRDIATWLGLPPHKLGDPSRTSFASLEQENQSYLDSTLDPWLFQRDTQIRAKLLTEAEQAGDTHVVESMRQALLRADASTRVTIYTAGLSWGWMSRNEVRASENLNPIEGGDRFFVPLNVGFAGAPAPTPAQEPRAEDRPAVVVQSLVFVKEKFPRVEQVMAWIHEHEEFHADKPPEETENSWRVRQRDPADFVEGSWRTINIEEGILGIVGRLKEGRDDASRRARAIMARDAAGRIARRIARAAERAAKRPEGFLDAHRPDALEREHGGAVGEILAPLGEMGIPVSALEVLRACGFALSTDAMRCEVGGLSRALEGAEGRLRDMIEGRLLAEPREA